MKSNKTVWAITIVLACAGLAQAQEPIGEEIVATPNCERTIKADVVAFDQPFFYNRLGAVNPAGMIYALRRDVEAKSTAGLVPGNVRLKKYKRARPIVLRMNVGDCIQILFQNLLDPNRAWQARISPPLHSKTRSSSPSPRCRQTSPAKAWQNFDHCTRSTNSRHATQPRSSQPSPLQKSSWQH